jgi:NADPH2:quinone reductase
MQAQAIAQFGEPNVFQTIELPKPEVIPGHVVIRVVATSVNPIDFKLRRGAMPAIAPDFPAVLHGDVAGVVEAVGEGVTTFKPGDEVYGCAGGFKGMGGALAEYMLADANLLALKPQSLSMREAAALPLVSITAWESLIYRAKVQPGQKVLVHAATGGVGHIGIQLAKWAGAEVYTTVSNPEKAAIARDLGADVAINYRQQTVDNYLAEHTSGKGFDVVFDTVGKGNLDRSFAAAKIHGTVVSISTRSTHDLSPLHAKGLTLHVVYMLLRLLHSEERVEHGKILFNIAKLVDQGTIRPLLDSKSFSFSEVAEAHRYAESGQAIGKIVLEV